MYIIMCSLFVGLVAGKELQPTPPRDSKYCPLLDYYYKLLERLLRSELAQKNTDASLLQLQTKLKRLETEVLEWKEIQRSKDDMSNATARNYQQPIAAFYAGLSKGILDVGLGYRPIMDRVFLNQGEAYDIRHGYFRAPSKGLYEFTVYVCSPPSKYVILFMMKEGQSVGFAFSTGTGYSCSSRSAVVTMKEGETIWLEMEGSAEGMFIRSTNHVEFRTSFSGFYIGTI